MSRRSNANLRFLIVRRLLSESRFNLCNLSSVIFLSASVKGAGPFLDEIRLLYVLHN